MTMALVKCPECQTEVSSEALDCPKCGKHLRKAKRTIFGKIVLWIFIIFNAIMLWWMITGMKTVTSGIDTAGSDAAKTGATIGAGLGFMMILTIWAFGDIILGLFTFLTRPKK